MMAYTCEGVIWSCAVAMPLELQRQAGYVIGEDYPAPIVDHGMARERMLLVYKA
jgi:deoxyribodipyrimidine photolyase